MASCIASPVPAGTSFFKKPRTENNRQRGRLKRGKRLNLMSQTRRLEAQVYSSKRKEFLEKYPTCQFKGCFAPSQECHHKHGRTGKNYLDTSTWSALCNYHHSWIHQHPNRARKMGLLK